MLATMTTQNWVALGITIFAVIALVVCLIIGWKTGWKDDGPGFGTDGMYP